MKETLAKLRRDLRRIYSDGEAEAIIRLIFEHLKSWTPVDIVLNEDKPLSDFMKGKVDAILARLMNHEPIQYITGQARFYGLDLKVAPGVLIPRPETEELVELIVRDADGKADLRVLDAGTGSGCIAIALARNLRFPQITAIDMSAEAIEIASENARNLKCRISFRLQDMLSLPADVDKWDIIVSNPPYICESEAKDMEANVLDYEPRGALFVPDNDPLRFYRALSGYAIKALAPSGRLYFEINPLHVDSLINLLTEQGFVNVLTHTDISGRKRFVSAMRPNDY